MPDTVFVREREEGLSVKVKGKAFFFVPEEKARPFLKELWVVSVPFDSGNHFNVMGHGFSECQVEEADWRKLAATHELEIEAL